MKFTVNQEIFSKFAPLKVAVVVLEGVNNKADVNAFFDSELAAITEGIRTKFNGVELAQYPVVQRWREIYKSFGEKDARSSIEALIKRIKNDKGLYRISPLVDIYNLASLKFELPAGGEDLDAITSDMELTFANGSEKFLPLGSTEVEVPAAGEVIYKFGDTVVCRNFNYRESDITKLTPSTSRAIIVFEDALGNDKNLGAAMDWICDKAVSLLGARVVKTAVLSEGDNEIGLLAD
ncbi:MAG: phenylalanine--tRNA ligase beta subunit-related protein [Alphaproteobacteria bacterium]|nr:phenylalanine--tRNA ligase beta subunit-related protein [Alphaproteobacteria bacterium]